MKKKKTKEIVIELSQEDVALYKAMREMRGMPYNEFKTGVSSILTYQKHNKNEKN